MIIMGIQLAKVISYQSLLTNHIKRHKPIKIEQIIK